MKSLRIAVSVVLMLLATSAFAQSNAQSSSDKPKNPAGSAAGQAAQGQTPEANPLSAFNKFIYGGTKNILLTTAEKMPEENYNFKPTDTVRSFGQIVGHVADAQYLFCSISLGEANPAPKIEQTKTSKADLVAALKDAFAYCDKAYDAMTDASATQPVKLFGGERPKLGALSVNNIHNMEHYGNLATYMRLKNLVPPTSEAGFQAVPKK
jgi:uncharacterized damage-inducible protein DinB